MNFNECSFMQLRFSHKHSSLCHYKVFFFQRKYHKIIHNVSCNLLKYISCRLDKRPAFLLFCLVSRKRVQATNYGFQCLTQCPAQSPNSISRSLESVSSSHIYCVVLVRQKVIEKLEHNTCAFLCSLVDGIRNSID